MGKFVHVSLIMCVMGLAVLAAGIPSARAASPEGFATWITQFKPRAIAAGLSPAVVNEALADVEFIPRAIDLDRKQPERKQSFGAYRAGVVSEARIAEGRRLYHAHRQTLRDIENEYGVPASVIVALWGIETNYGKNQGGFEVVDVLATLAYEGRRHEFFQNELIAALRILQEGHIPRHKMKGSWAGAMGQNQFMPSSFRQFAQDHDGDGRRDIWGNRGDVFASSAHYLNQSGWVEGEKWGRAVMLPKNFPEKWIGLKGGGTPVSLWTKRGVTLPKGKPLPQSEQVAWIVRPADQGRQAFMVYQNYQVIMRWNRSTYFATSVGLLSDAIAAGR